MLTLGPMTKRAAPRSADFGQRLRRLRQAKGLTQQQVADAVDCTQRAMVYYEKEGKLPPAAIAAKMAALFAVSVEEFLEHADAPTASKRPAAAPDLVHSVSVRPPRLEPRPPAMKHAALEAVRWRSSKWWCGRAVAVVRGGCCG